ncbi:MULTISPECIES: hypothetical protein [Borrelia]|uniref:Uncharacterized protein n=1 Tax=Borrelia turicatae TaxID=142 RepID=A0A172XC28_BORTU|nr:MULTISPECIES: hypothetical protein [Borrelia]ANF34200.1 hypothetical protein A7978_03795 [Borrelia turicatae]UPA12391.1 hypothetical protein bvRMA01_000759 [Borrelia venezuelensis]UPA13564.1 hypothetical protein bt91E135_000756 [Borrelia turicatae 91E135]UPA15046.1 hypothetical protein btBTE5EL_000754 [Borrelia turicatae]
MFFVASVLFLFLTFFYFINEFLNQIDFDFDDLIDDVKSYNINFFRDLDLENYFDKTLFDNDLVNSYYLLSSVNGMLIYKSKDDSIYKLTDKLEPTFLTNSVFVKKIKVNFELNNALVSLVVYYNILPKSRILYILHFYLFVISLAYFCFSVFVLYCIYRDINDGDHDARCYLLD